MKTLLRILFFVSFIAGMNGLLPAQGNALKDTKKPSGKQAPDKNAQKPVEAAAAVGTR